MSRHASWLLGVAFLLTAAGLAGCAASRPSSTSERVEPTAATSGTPRIAVDTDSLDFGKVAVNEMVDAVFEVKNVGDAPLVLNQAGVRAKEGC